ncbi:MAG: lipoate--protein ligase family protein [Ignavibacteria bacterium]|nr:lipoate--protein ligase family protein [Ignavibacteria bacterium]
MARDLELLETVRAGIAPFAFETYTWEPWAVSLGKHQSINAIDVDKAREMGIDVVWRPTGGRAILHADELTYCVAVRGNPRDVYRRVHDVIRRALDRIVPHALNGHKAQPDLRQFYASGTRLGQVCFASSVTDELMHNGRKVVGSAQRVIDGIVLQHGSILCGPAHQTIADILAVKENDRSEIKQQLNKLSISLSEIAGRRIDPLTVAREIEQIDVVYPSLSAIHE